MATIGSLSVKLGLVTVEWDKATDKAKQQAKQLQAAFNDLTADVKKLGDAWKTLGGSIGVGSVGLTALIAKTADFADQIGDLSKAFGISTGFALQFNNALQQAGSSGQAASKIITKLFENIESAKEGNQQAVDQFRNLGISFSEIKKLSPEDAIKKVFAQLSQIEDPIKRVDQMRKAFGKGGLGLDVEQVSALLEGGIGKWEKYGQQLQKVANVKDNLAASLDNLLISFSQFIGPLTRDGTVSVEKFTGALAGMFAYFVASRIVAAATAMMEIVAAIRAATAASVAFNLATAGTPIGLLLKLGAMGVGAAVYASQTGAFERNPQNKPGANATYGQEPPSLSAETEANNPAVVAAVASSVSGSDETTLQEAAAQMGLLVERTKTANMAALAGVSIWDDYGRKITQLNNEYTLGLAQIKQKQAEINNQHKDSPILLGIETAKLKEQEKQLKINLDLRKKELQEAKILAEYEQAKAQRLIFANEYARAQADIQARIFEDAKYGLDVKKQELSYAEELAKIELEISTASSSSKQSSLAILTSQASIAKLKAELQSLPAYVDAEYGQELSKEDEANNRKRENIQKQINFEQQRHELRMNNFEIERTFDYGWEKSMNEFLDQSTNAAKMASDSFGSIVSNMESALTNFVRTGKMSFKDLTKSIIQDLLLIQMKAQLSGIFRMFGSFFGGNPIGASGYSDLGTFNSLMAAGGLANGGTAQAGDMHLVGERGPELFVPRSTGTVIPNEKLGSLGGSTTVNNYNIQAIDVKSFEERIMGSSNAIWAANIYAQKRLPLGAGRM